MNERIRELARRVVGKHKGDTGSISLFDEQIEEFADLVRVEAYQEGFDDGWEQAEGAYREPDC